MTVIDYAEHHLGKWYILDALSFIPSRKGASTPKSISSQRRLALKEPVEVLSRSICLLSAKFTMLFVALLALPLLLLALYFFFKADADFALTLKGRTPRKAIEFKVVWIIGASQNIGEELANEYARLGAKLILTSRRPHELERVKALLNTPHDVVILPGDVSAGVDVLRELVAKAEAAFDNAGVDIIVHNAASPRLKTPAADFPDDALQQTFDVNVLAVIRLTQLALQGMLRRGRGQFVVVSSSAAKLPSPGQSVYSASKHAVNGYFHSLRSEVLQSGVHVTLACPGPIEVAGGADAHKDKRLPARRCAQLIVQAGAHDVMEAWISYQPILLLLYVMQYVPALAFYVVNKIGPKRVKSYSEGSSVYSMSLLFKKSS